MEIFKPICIASYVGCRGLLCIMSQEIVALVQWETAALFIYAFWRLATEKQSGGDSLSAQLFSKKLNLNQTLYCRLIFHFFSYIKKKH
jgi:hypothetical protein